jgi:hypothetical protein
LSSNKKYTKWTQLLWGSGRTGSEAAKEMKLELIPNLASRHYLHWIQLVELEKQEKSVLNGCYALH